MLFKTSLEKALFSSPAACIKSIDARLTKLRKKYADGTMDDIQKLEELREALVKIKPEHFSRYQQLLSLLKSGNYGWTREKDDRLVIFTERIETMKYLAEHRGAAVTRDQLMNEVWGYDYIGDSNIVDVYIRYLRHKIDDQFDIKTIHTIRSVGYLFDYEEEQQ